LLCFQNNMLQHSLYLECLLDLVELGLFYYCKYFLLMLQYSLLHGQRPLNRGHLWWNGECSPWCLLKHFNILCSICSPWCLLKHFISYIGELLIGLPAERSLLSSCTQATQRGGFVVFRSALVPFEGEAWMHRWGRKQLIQVQLSRREGSLLGFLFSLSIWFC
jgi:hypothetical protein